MKIVNIIGGLGNQMFQCAFAIALKEKHPLDDVKLDISHFNGYGLHNGYEISSVFSNYPLPIAEKNDIKKLSYYIPKYKSSRIMRRILPYRKSEFVQPYQHAYIYNPNALTNEGDMYYEGYWMSPLYFEACKDSIVKAFSFKPFDTEVNLEYEKLLHEGYSVTIHIRRGDYVGAENFKDICTLAYYRNAIMEVKKYIETPVFFVFSNDQQWCTDNLKDEFGDSIVYFVSNNRGKESYRDMQLMSLARCNILANSSFSWWGAYLNQRKDHLVFCPCKWVNNLEHKDHYIDSWHKVEIV